MCVELVEEECADGLAHQSADSLSLDRFGEPGEGVRGAQDRVADGFGALHRDDASVVAGDEGQGPLLGRERGAVLPVAAGQIPAQREGLLASPGSRERPKVVTVDPGSGCVDELGEIVVWNRAQSERPATDR
jgi:hypothetical protein